MTTVLRIAGVIAAFLMLAIAVPLPHIDELRDVDAFAVAPLGAEAQAVAPAVCDKSPKTANLNFVLKDSTGKDFNLASLKGKVILLDFWATWCPPCKVEIPWFVEFQQKYGPRGFVVVGVSVDDSPSRLKPFADQYKVNYPLLVGEGRDDIKGPRAYNAAWGLPKTFVIGRDGNICKTHVGLSVKEHFEQQIKALL
jgi:peroxiredoxin